MDELFHLKIVSKEGVLYEGDIKSLSSYNTKGKFDVLALHSNFISIIQNKISIVDKNGDVKEFEIKKALLRNKENRLEIYSGIDNISA